MPQFVWSTGTIPGNAEVYSNRNAPYWPVTMSGTAPTGSAWVINSAFLRYCVRNAYGSTHSFYVRQNSYTGTIIGELTPDAGSTAGVWNVSYFSAAEIANKNNFLGFSAICLMGNGGTAMQLLGTTEITLTVNWSYTTSTAGAPTSVSVASARVYTDTVTLSWSGATAGTGNSITGYGIQYADSADGSTWGSWNDLTTISSTATSASASVNINPNPGQYRRYRVRTQGSAGSSYYSGYSSAAATVQRYGKCTAPNVVLASTNTPPLEETFCLEWSGAGCDTGDTIAGYAIYRSEEMDGTFEEIGTMSTSETTGLFYTVSSDVFGGQYVYRVVTLSSLSSVYDSDLSTACAVVTSGYGLCAAPTSVTAVPNATYPSGMVRLEWSGAEDGYLNPLTGYEIVRGTSQNGNFYTFASGIEDTQYPVPAPPDTETEYYYRVIALGTINGYDSHESTACANVIATEQGETITGGVGRTNATAQ